MLPRLAINRLPKVLNMPFFDPFIILWLQSILPYWAWDVLNLLGDDIIYVGLLGIAYWCVSKKQGAIAVNLLMFSSFFNVLFKYAFHMERPPTSLRHKADYINDTSYGFPSGATQSATTFWGWASVKLRRWYVWIIGAIMIVITALARMGLGMHWLGDVLGGIAIGIVIVAMAYFLVPFFDKRWGYMPRLLQDWLLPLVALVFFGIYYVAFALSVIPYFPTENVGVSMGVVFGFGTGVALETHYVNLKMDVPRNTRILRAVVGLIIALVLYVAFSAIFDLLSIGDLFAIRFVKYAIVGFFGAFVIPALFKAIHR
jgi:membrane-associated phospholipid phosphatase